MSDTSRNTEVTYMGKPVVVDATIPPNFIYFSGVKIYMHPVILAEIESECSPKQFVGSGE